MPHILNILIWFPIFSGCFLLAVAEKNNDNVSRYLGLFSTLICLLLCGILVSQFDSNSDAMQFKETIQWLPNLGISYSLGIDGLSLLMIVSIDTFLPLLSLKNGINDSPS